MTTEPSSDPVRPEWLSGVASLSGTLPEPPSPAPPGGGGLRAISSSPSRSFDPGRLPPLVSGLLLLSLLLSGCQIPYLVTQLGGQARLSASALPIEEVLARRDLAPETRARLEEVPELLAFARRQGFSVGDAYRTFAEPVEGVPVWIVTACPPDSLELIEWSYPIVGSFPYRGFFRRRLAEHEAERLRALGLEVDLRPAQAYSTLGWFADPVVPTLIAGDPGERAAGILHELAHRTIFLPGDARLNESISVSVERYAVAAWLREQGRTEAAREHARRCSDRELLRREICSLLETLRRVFEATDRQERLRGKEEAMQSFAERLRSLSFQSARSASWAEVSWTLPRLLLFDVYGGDGELLDRAFTSVGARLPAYFDLLRAATGVEDPRGFLEAAGRDARPPTPR